MTHEVPFLPRTVKPRARVSVKPRPIIAVTATIVYVERTGEYHDPSQVFTLLRSEKPSTVVCEGMAHLLCDLDDHFKDDPLWQYSVTPLERELWKANRESTVITKQATLVNFFGWKSPDKKGNLYHHTLDPVCFAGRAAATLIGEPGRIDIEAITEWAIQLRDFCQEHGLNVKGTTGGIAGQFLRDPRFYPEARRKVPMATNETARPHLPGNHYRLFVEEEREVEAYYLDQKAAHHNCAATLTFPCSNRLYAVGHYRGGDTTRPGVPRSMQDKVLKSHGLFHLRVTVPDMHHGTFPPPWAETPGQQDIWVYSNELPLLRQLDVHIDHIIAAWVSTEVDTGLNEYAKWSLELLATKPAPWVKPTLLAAYGILASRPRTHTVGYRQALGGTLQFYPAGRRHIRVLEYVSERATEPGFANVIHRGMIEAETRQRSLAFARDLHSRNFHILACYADSVFIATRNREGVNVPLPLLPPGWEVEAELTRLRFLNPVSFTSDQVTKLPGIPGRDVVLRASFGTRGSRDPAARRKTAERAGALVKARIAEREACR